MEKRTRRKFSKEFKLEAVKLSEERGLTEAASSLGLGTEVLCRWRKAYQKVGAEAFRGNGNRTVLEEELRQSHREIRRLREELEILKKASAYFARHLR